jgi:5'-nucleotidase/UDP-sugar diphosphatase
MDHLHLPKSEVIMNTSPSNTFTHTHQPISTNLRALICSLLLGLCFLSACQASPSAEITQLQPTEVIVQPTQAPATPTFQATVPPSGPVDFTILYTDDEHGWMVGEEEGQGAADLLGLLQEQEGYGQNPSVILLSGGDNWTGPAISTWFDGQGMIEVMNAMGYSASAVGNHEFDLGLDILRTRISEAHYPYLSANLRYASSHSIPYDLGIQPYTILDVNGLHVGVIGLSLTNTPQVTNPTYVSSLEFLDYADTLREIVPQVREDGAQVILVIAHACPDELYFLAHKVSDLGIPFMGGGHCHITYKDRVGNTVIVTSGAYLTGYAYANLSYDPSSGTVSIQDFGIHPNQGGKPDAEVAAIVARWQAKVDVELDHMIGYLAKPIRQRSIPMQDLITGSWLWSYPTADIALTNLGGMRTDLDAGELTLADLVSVMPFDNTLVDVHLTGAQVRNVLVFGVGSLAMSGLHRSGLGWVVDKTDQPLEEEQTYSVLVNNFMYAGGDGFSMLAEYDPQAYDTGIDWRQPVIDWITAQSSTPESPLDAAIEGLGK